MRDKPHIVLSVSKWDGSYTFYDYSIGFDVNCDPDRVPDLVHVLRNGGKWWSHTPDLSPMLDIVDREHGVIISANNIDGLEAGVAWLTVPILDAIADQVERLAQAKVSTS